MDGTRRPLFSLRSASAIAITIGLVAVGSFIGVQSASADAVPPGSVIDQQNTTGDTCSTSQTFGQAFEAGTTGELTAVGIDIRANYSDSTDVHIEATTGGLPNGTVLATGTYIGAFSGVVALQTPAPVVAGTTYALILSGSLALGCSFSNPYPGGMLVYTANGPWLPDPNLDLVFSTYVRPPGIPQVSDVSASTPEGAAVDIPLVETGAGITGHTLLTAPAHGSVTFAGSTATYTPTGWYSGPDSFTYFATNAQGDSTPATVSVTVVPPTISTSASTVVAGGELTVEGYGFPPNLWVDIRVGPDSSALATPKTSASGTFSRTVTVPAITANGAHTIYMTGQGVTSASLPLTVTGSTLTHAVTFDPADGTPAPDDQSVTDAGMATEPPAPTRATFVFDGWWNGADRWDFATDTVTAPVTLTAHWIAVPTITGPAAADLPLDVAFTWTPTISAAPGFVVTSTTLPAGLVLDPATGVISGTPSGSLGTTVVTVTLTSPAGVETTDVALTVTHGAAATVTITPSDATPNQGGTITVVVEAQDAHDNTWDATADATITSSVSSDVIVGDHVTFPHASPHRLTATLALVSGSALIQVSARPALLGLTGATVPLTALVGAGAALLLGVVLRRRATRRFSPR